VSALILLGIGTAVMFAIMSAVWLFARRINNYSVVDGAWPLSFTVVALIFAIGAGGWPWRKLLMLATVSAWSLRLGFFLVRRIYSHHPHEDGRYAALRAEYAPRVERGFFRFFHIQGASVILLSAPFLLMALNPAEQFSPLELIGAGLWFLSLLGEAVADRQLSRFKRDPANRGKVCDRGLWRYSRHPNYFFESCIWFSFYLMSAASPYGIYTVFAPLFILYILLKVTGVPPAEAQSLKSRGDLFRAYQRRTSMFVPWFPKEGI